MKEKIQIEVTALKEDERLEMAKLLIKSGYAVRLGKSDVTYFQPLEKPKGDQKTMRYIKRRKTVDEEVIKK